MANLFLLFFVLIVIFTLMKVMWKPNLIFEYPYFMTAIFAVFILPQAFSLIRFPGGVSDSAIADVMLMTLLCVVSVTAGYKIQPSSFICRKLSLRVNFDKMFQVGVLFTFVSFVFAFLLARSEVTINDQGGMTGIGTIYLFFTNLAFPGFAICLLITLGHSTLKRLFFTVLAGLIPLVNVISIRREPSVVFVLTLFLGLYFYKRYVPPRVAIFGGLIFASLAIPATGYYRSMMNQGVFAKEFSRFNLIQNFQDYFGKESILEFRNAAAIIESTKRFDSYQYGAGYWDQLVFRYVPAQIIGAERKNALRLGSASSKVYENTGSLGHEYATGTTLTGMGDSFQNFGWFGCLFFVLLASFFRTLWMASLSSGALFAQLLYILSCSSAMRAVTHQTSDFLPGLIYQILFLGLGVIYAKERPDFFGRTTSVRNNRISRYP